MMVGGGGDVLFPSITFQNITIDSTLFHEVTFANNQGTMDSQNLEFEEKKIS